MREKYRNPIASIKKFPQFTIMNVIDGQAGLIICASLIFYSLTTDNILNIIVLLILAGISISMLSGENGILTRAGEAKEKNDDAKTQEKLQLAINGLGVDYWGNISTRSGSTFRDYIFSTKGQTGINKELDGNATFDSNSYTITYKGKVYMVDEDGRLSEYKPVPITGITLASTTALIEQGRNTTLTANKEPANATENIKWVSETPAVVMVEETTGKITGVATGTAVIKATNPDGSIVSANSCTVTVTEAVSEIDGPNPDMIGRFGEIVDYNVDLGKDKNGNDLTWKVFYDDGTNVYLIASDCVQLSNSNIPSSLGNTTNNQSKFPYGFYWEGLTGFATYKNDTIVSEATGTTDIFINNPTGTKYLTERGLLGFWKNSLGTIPTNGTNAKMTACLMDTTAWSKFATEYVGAYAIGGPTLSLWVESWNAKHGDNTTDNNKAQLYYNRTNRIGYYLNIGSQPTNQSSVAYSTMNTMDGYSDTLYYPHTSSYNNCGGYWLASPSANYDYFGMIVNTAGYVGAFNYSNGQPYNGVRPVVCLPSEVTISNEKTNGKYTIVNK